MQKILIKIKNNRNLNLLINIKKRHMKNNNKQSKRYKTNNNILKKTRTNKNHRAKKKETSSIKYQLKNCSTFQLNRMKSTGSHQSIMQLRKTKTYFLRII